MTQENNNAILVPMGKEGWSKGDILKWIYDSSVEYMIAEKEYVGTSIYWQAKQLIIVDTMGSWDSSALYFFEEEGYIHELNDACDGNYCSKIIGAYPALHNTPELPLQFVQDYVNSGEGCRVMVGMEPCCEVNCTGECVSNKSHWKYEINPDNTLAISLVKEEKPKQRCKECGLWMYPKDGLRLEYCHDCSLNTNDGWQQSDNIDNAGKEDEDIKLTKQVAIENGKVVRIYSPEWAKSGRLDPEDLLKYVIATFKQREHLVAYVSVLHDKIDELLSTTPATSPVDVEQMAKEYAESNFPIWIVNGKEYGDQPYDANHESRKAAYNAFIEGYTANTKHYSEEDLKREAISFGEWLRSKAQPKAINRYWVLNSDKIKKEYHISELYTIYKNK